MSPIDSYVDTRKRLTARNVAMTVLVVVFLFFVKALIDGIWLRMLVCFGVICIATLSLYCLKSNKYLIAMHLLLLAIWFACLLSVATNGGGVSNPGISWFLILVCCAGLLVGESGLRVWSVVAVTSVVAFLGLELLGVELPDLNVPGGSSHQIVFTVFAQLISLISLVLLFLRQFIRYDDTISVQFKQLNLEIEQRKIAEDEALGAAKARQQFMANMSHELRTPLNSIIGFSHLLMRKVDDQDTKIARSLESIHRNGKALLNFVNELIELGSVEGHRYSEISTFSLDKLLRDNVEALIVRANNVGLSFCYDCVQDVSIVGNPQGIQRAIINLCYFAIRQSNEGLIAMTLSVIDECALLTINDSGASYTTDQMATLFEPHYDHILNSEKDMDASALSLVIAKRILDDHDCITKVDSHLGAGTQFSVRFPRRNVIR